MSHVDIDCSIRHQPGASSIWACGIISLLILVVAFRSPSRKFWFIMIVVSMLPLVIALVDRSRLLAQAKIWLASDPAAEAKMGEVVIELNEIYPVGITTTVIPLLLTLMASVVTERRRNRVRPAPS